MGVVRKTIHRRIESVKPKKLQRSLTLKEFYAKRNKILFIRTYGGLGDIFMHRMMFEDFKRIMPDAEIHFACPKYYHDALRDHPYIDQLLEVSEVQKHEYVVSYNTSSACGRHEMKLAPFSGKHRSDIWANHCGVELQNHNMHITLTEEEKQEGRRLIEEKRNRNGISIAISPISAMQSKNLQEHQLVELIKGLNDRNCYAFCLHHEPIHMVIKNDIPMVSVSKIRNWMAVINQVDCVISVDTAAFHCAGGMGKPLIGVFTFADGMVYGKHFDFLLVQKHREIHPEWTCGPCYNWVACPKTNAPLKPCLTELTSEMILDKVDIMLSKLPRKGERICLN